MKIECDKCQAKYSIADDKVRGKTFKIRCKKCSNVIIVRNKDAAAQKDDGDAAEAGADDAPDAGWHLAIDGETVGPVSEDDLRQRYASGEIDKDTAVWQEGFEDWVALGDVDQFRDLPDPQPSAAPQPATAMQGFAASSARASVPERSSAAESLPSPRVDAANLTAQRNENSVLFSLDNLRAMATASVDTRPAPALGLATSAPTSEGSGLIDIRALSGLTAAPQASAREREDALPSFGGAALGGGSLGGLVNQPLVIEPAVAVAGGEGQRRSMTPIYVMMGFMLVLLVVLGGVVFSLLNREAPQERIVVREVPGKVADEDKSDEDDDQKDRDDAKDEEDGKDGDDKDSAKSDRGTKVASASKSSRPSSAKRSRSSGRSRSKSTPSRSRSDSRSGSRSGSSVDDIASGEVPKSGSNGGGGDGLSEVDCLLDPSKCGKSSSKKSSSRSKSASTASKPSSSGGSNANLPDALDRASLQASFAKVKGAAAACGKKHGAPDGTKVRVKVSIQGSTGRVTSATPESPWGGKPLGNCVAGEAKKAQFDKFAKPQMGLVYSFRM